MGSSSRIAVGGEVRGTYPVRPAVLLPLLQEPAVVRVPDVERHRREFGALPFSERRAVVRAVSRGRAVENRKHAGHAVLVARRQARLWRYLWLLGPLMGLVQIGQGWQAVLASGLMTTTMMALLSYWWYSRARRAEQANLALTTDGKRGGKRDPSAASAASRPKGTTKSRGRGHIPRSGGPRR
jgi:hypothetical protein